MASFIRMSFTLVFHQSEYISTVKRTLFDNCQVCILVLFYVTVFLVIAMYA